MARRICKECLATCYFTAATAVIAVVGAAVSAVGTIKQGEAQAQQAAYQARVAKNNAQIAEQMAQSEIQAGIREAEMKSLETSARVAKVKAAQAAQGVDITTGSAVDVQESERKIGKLDAETVLSNAQLKAYGYRARATSEEAQAGLYGMVGSDARTASYLSAGGTLLSKASSLPYGSVFGGGGGFSGTAAGAAQYGSPGYAGSSTFGGPR